jgi:hypothetical protein
VNAAAPRARIAVGVVVERRKAASQWIDFTWKPVSILVGTPDAAGWTLLSATEDGATFYAGAAEIALHRTETAHYISNLAASAPALWVALRPTGVEPPFAVVAVTADPAEGESFTQAGDDLVEAVPMPAAVRDIVAAFVAEHHVERPFVKRKRDRADPQAMAPRGPLQKGRPR